MHVNMNYYISACSFLYEEKVDVRGRSTEGFLYNCLKS